MNHTSSETPRWVVLTGEQRDHLEQDVTVRGRRGAVLVEGPVDHVSEHGEVTIGHGRDGVVVTGPVEVRERDVPQLEHTGEPDLLAALAASVARARARRDDAAPTAGVIDVAHLERQRQWSKATFGPGDRLDGVIEHIKKELAEVKANPSDVIEWADVLILAFDGAWRSGHEPQDVIDAIKAKQARNERRTWPDWRTADPGKAIEHIRDEEADR